MAFKAEVRADIDKGVSRVQDSCLARRFHQIKEVNIGSVHELRNAGDSIMIISEADCTYVTANAARFVSYSTQYTLTALHPARLG